MGLFDFFRRRAEDLAQVKEEIPVDTRVPFTPTPAMSDKGSAASIGATIIVFGKEYIPGEQEDGYGVISNPSVHNPPQPILERMKLIAGRIGGSFGSSIAIQGQEVYLGFPFDVPKGEKFYVFARLTRHDPPNQRSRIQCQTVFIDIEAADFNDPYELQNIFNTINWRSFCPIHVRQIPGSISLQPIKKDFLGAKPNGQLVTDPQRPIELQARQLMARFVAAQDENSTNSPISFLFGKPASHWKSLYDSVMEMCNQAKHPITMPEQPDLVFSPDLLPTAILQGSAGPVYTPNPTPK